MTSRYSWIGGGISYLVLYLFNDIKNTFTAEQIIADGKTSEMIRHS